MKRLHYVMFVALSALLGLGATSNLFEAKYIASNQEIELDENGFHVEPMDVYNDYKPAGEYVEGSLLVQTSYDVESLNEQYDYGTFSKVSQNWVELTLNSDLDTIKTLNELREKGTFNVVDYNYVMESDGVIDDNPRVSEQTYLETTGTKKAWEYLESHGISGGGSSDVIVAVIDTGIDYNHEDLRNNVWRNIDEIPGNGIDDDGNGYIDDVYGWNFVADTNDATDDNGHGTHVSGIIAAENNDKGVVGIAYNTKVMPLKAGNSSGYFNNSDIAEAIEYAYMNGASVINMSFGGSTISLAVEDALQMAYTDCVLVGAAGNDGMCNNPACKMCDYTNSGTYPAALPYVIGVMSCDGNCTAKSSFTNYDHYPHNSVEYDIYAPGESILSTFPGNKYARMSGTSMATPVVSGAAAMVRSLYPDKNSYSNKYIRSQLNGSGDMVLTHSSLDVYNSLTKYTNPELSLYDYYIFDNEEFSENNNGNGVVDAGETIRIGIELLNVGGVAGNVKATIDTKRSDIDENIVDPYITINKNTIELDYIGIYATKNCSLIKDDADNIIGVEKYFEITLSSDTPNDYLCDINLNVTYENALEYGKASFTLKDVLQISITKGIEIGGTIYTEDTVLKGDATYIISDSITVAESATLTFEAGAKIQFYGNYLGVDDTFLLSPNINVYGTLIFNGTEENMISLSTSEIYLYYGYKILQMNDTASIVFNHCKIANLITNQSSFIKDKGIFLNSCYLDNSNLRIRIESNGEQFQFYDCYFSKVTNSTVKVIQTDYEFHSSRFHIIDSYNSLYISDCSLSAKLTSFSISFGRWNMDNEILNNIFSLKSAKDGETTIEVNGSYKFVNNLIFGDFNSRLPSISFNNNNFNSENVYGNKLLYDFEKYKDKIIQNYYNSDGTSIWDKTTQDDQFNPKLIAPYIKDIVINDGNNKVGPGTNSFKVVFSKEMDTSKEFNLKFGSEKPYAEYRIDGEFVSNFERVGTFKTNSLFDDGTNYFSIDGGISFEGESLVDNSEYFSFEIDTTSALSMNLFAEAKDEGVELTWLQDDYDTLMGYNIYRSDDKNGNYVKINNVMIPADENTYLDTTAKSGETYWYTFTVVLSDFTESNPSGRVEATMIDSTAPRIIHTPVNQWYYGNNLTITSEVTDNISVTSVTLYYRTTGETSFKSMTMLKKNSTYSATIYGSEISMDGLEYYIEATDGTNVVTVASSENPYQVVIKDASLIAQKGDVDGDGVVDTKDALKILYAIDEKIILTDDEFKRADLDNSGVLTTSEALRILQYINGNVSSLEM